MKDYKIIFISFVLFIFMLGAVNAVDSDEVITNEVDVDDTVSVDDSSILSDSNNAKEIYVNDTGDDSNTGSAESPYATINKAVSNVTDSDKATIYLSEGTFASDNDTNFNIQLLHKRNGGSLSFIGAGADKTIIDGQSAFRFAIFGYNTNITLKDICFINCKQNFGGVIRDDGGILNIENCVFKDSYVTGTQGGAIYISDNGVLNVKDSQFISCSVKSTYGNGAGGAIYSNGIASMNLENNLFIGTTISSGMGVAVYTNSKSYISGNKFINLTGTNDASIYINSQGSTICNNEFINCSNPSTTYSILNIAYGSCELKNNTFTNSSNSVGNIYSTGQVSGLTVTMENNVIDVSNSQINNGIDILVNVTDDMGNIVKTNSFTINFVNENNTYTFNPFDKNGKSHINFGSMPEVGIYNVTATCGGTTTDVLATANIHYSNELVELYVSPEGSDANNGTQEFPFETIAHAIDVGFEKTFNVVVHLLEGTYSGDGNVELRIANKGTLQIIGEKYGETIIDGNEETWFLAISTESIIKNLKFINGVGKVISGKVTLLDCIVDNCNGEGDPIIGNVNMDNLTFTNNYGFIELSLSNNFKINNSYFANNYNEYGSGILYSSLFSPLTIENCKFINNTVEEYGGAIFIEYAFLGVEIKDSYFEGNSAQDGGAIYVPTEGGYITFENNTFKNNNAVNNGVLGFNYEDWDVYMTPALVFNDCRFINNSAVKGGVASLKIAIFTDCSFINNTADYGGALNVLAYCIDPDEPVYTNPDEEEMITTLELNNVVFENNIAKINGNDIYLGEKNYMYDADYLYQYIPLTITFNNKTVNSLIDDLTATVTGPCDAIIGSAYDMTFEFDGTKIGSAKIINGVATLNYAGFEDGEYVLSGNSYLPNSENVINEGTITVRLEDIKDHLEFWISPEGSDEDGNGSQTNPFKSISHAVNEASKKSRDIVINIAEGTFAGDLNTGLSLSSMNNITLIGAGINKTIIDGENINYFATITDGKNIVIISNLTIKNMLPDNRQTKIINSANPITINDGATLLLDTVEIVDNHGGEAIIINNGNLTINNSIFKRNGFSLYGIEGSNIIIDDCLFEDNYVKFTLISGNDLVINNSEIKNIYNVIDATYQLTFDLINKNPYAEGNVTIENTKISNDGSVEALNELGVTTSGKFVNPALAINGNVNMNNCSMVNNFNGTLNTNQQASAYLSILGFVYGQRVKTADIHNSSFANFQYIWGQNAGGILKFDGCLFENLDNIAFIRNVGDSIYNFNNCIFMNCTTFIKFNHERSKSIPMDALNFNTNYWGNNTPSTFTFGDLEGIREETYTPDNWIILTLEENEPLFKLTNGENTTSYEGTLPAKISYIVDENGNVIPVVNIAGTGYKFTVDENGTVVLNITNPIKDVVPLVPVNETVFANNVSLKIGEAAVFTANFTDKWGLPLKNTIVSFIIGENTINATTDANGTASFDIDFGLGAYTVVVTNPATSQNISRSIDITTDDTIAASDVTATYGVPSKFIANFTDQYGKALANTNVTFKVGNGVVNAITDANGTASFDIDLKPGIFGVEIINPVTGQSISKTITVTVAETISASDVTATYGDAAKFAATFTDQYGVALAYTNVTFKVGENTINATTDVNGTASFDVNFDAGKYNVTIANPVTGQAVTKAIVVSKLATKLTATKVNMVYNTGKSLKATLKDANGKALEKQTVYIKINGKTYKRTTNAKGQVSLKITLPVKKSYTATVTYNGNANYANSSASAKVVVKKASPKMAAKAKTFKTKTKKYTIVLKDNKGKAMKKAKVTLTTKVKGKTVKLTVKTKNNGKATFNLKKLVKGKYTASVKFAGNKNFKATTKKVKITVKK